MCTPVSGFDSNDSGVYPAQFFRDADLLKPYLPRAIEELSPPHLEGHREKSPLRFWVIIYVDTGLCGIHYETGHITRLINIL
jgi:hypothetical protein